MLGICPQASNKPSLPLNPLQPPGARKLLETFLPQKESFLPKLGAFKRPWLLDFLHFLFLQSKSSLLSMLPSLTRKRNFGLFHVKTITRRKHNNIRQIKNNIGDWVDLKDQVMDIILKGFIDLYQSYYLTSISPLDFKVDQAVSLSDDNSRKLSCNFTNQEIHKAIFSLKPFKALGMDGLHASYFHHFQHTMGPFVIKEIQSIFSSKKAPSYLNQTLVVLIPKRDGPETLVHFRPISLCSTVYKTVSKIIINKIRPHMHHLVVRIYAL